MYDWGVRAIIMKDHQSFFNFFAADHLEESVEDLPFRDNGRFFRKHVSDRNLENLIYFKAMDYKFDDPC